MANERYLLTAPAYLRMKANPEGDPIYIPSDTEVGDGTPYDFAGPPILAMSPITQEAKDTHAAYLDSIESGIPMTVKGGAGKPFDPADANSDSAAEKESAKKKADEDAKQSAAFEEQKRSFETYVQEQQRRLEEGQKAAAADADKRAAELKKQEEDLQKRLKALAEAEAKAKADTAKTPTK